MNRSRTLYSLAVFDETVFCTMMDRHPLDLWYAIDIISMDMPQHLINHPTQMLHMVHQGQLYWMYMYMTMAVCLGSRSILVMRNPSFVVVHILVHYTCVLLSACMTSVICCYSTTVNAIAYQGMYLDGLTPFYSILDV